MKYFLRAAKNADFDFLYRLKVAYLKEYVEAIWGWDEATLQRLFSDSFDPAASQIVVAWGRDVGQLSVQEDAHEIFLSGIYLLPAYQRQGLGSRILGDLLAEARANGRPVRLQVLVGNPVRTLYERFGFVIIDKSETHYSMRAR